MALGNGERYYNPSYGRFIQQDSYAGMPNMPQSLNRFSYTYNNPNKYTDPSGNVPILIPILIGVLFATRVETGRLNAEARRMERGLTQSEAGNSSAIGLGEAVGLTSVINGLSGQDIYTARDLGKWEARGQLALGVLEVGTNVFGLGQSVGTGTKLLKNGVKAYQASSGGVQGGKELIKKGYGGLKNGAKAEYAKTIDELTTLKPFAETGLGQSFFSAKETFKSGYNRIRSSRNTVKKRSIQDNPVEEFDNTQIYNREKNYFEVEIDDAGKANIGEFDEIKFDKSGGSFIENKSAEGLKYINPKTGLPSQTATKWADKHIYKKTVTRIDNLLNKAATTRRKAEILTNIPSLDEIIHIRRLKFRVESNANDVQKAVNNEVKRLNKEYPDWEFNAEFGN